MRERLVLVLAGVLLITVLVGGLLTWQSMKMTREVNQAILAKLDSMNTSAPRPEVSENWAKAKIRLVRGTSADPPVVGKQVAFVGKAFNDADSTSFDGTSDSQGATMFGPVRPGVYGIGIQYPLLRLGRANVNLFPGQLCETTITVPEWADTTCDVQVRVAPRGQIKEGTLLTCMLLPDQTDVRCGQSSWDVFGPTIDVTMAGAQVTSLFEDSYGKIATSMPAPGVAPVAPRLMPGLRQGVRPGFQEISIRSRRLSRPLETAPATKLPPIAFRLARLEAWIPDDRQAGNKGTVREWLQAAVFDCATQEVSSGFSPASPSITSLRSGPPPAPLSSEARKALPVVDVKLNGENIWTIELPPAFVKQANVSAKQLNESDATREQARLEEEKLGAEQKEVQSRREQQRMELEKTPAADRGEPERGQPGEDRNER